VDHNHKSNTRVCTRNPFGHLFNNLCRKNGKESVMQPTSDKYAPMHKSYIAKEL